ncbi:MAG: hypothetical protein ACRC3B_01010, partial [Bacteroidia bacterium]
MKPQPRAINYDMGVHCDELPYPHYFISMRFILFILFLVFSPGLLSVLQSCNQTNPNKSNVSGSSVDSVQLALLLDSAYSLREYYPDISIEILKKIISLTNTSQLQLLKADAYIQYGRLAENRGNADTAIAYYRKAKSIDDEADNRHGMARDRYM